jgi:type IV secretion system protein VirD4
MTAGSLLDMDANYKRAVWKQYWREVWHTPVPWSAQKLSRFLTAEEGRRDIDPKTDEPLVADFPRGLRPFLGIVTNGSGGLSSPASGVLEFNDDGHLLTVAPTRSGKGVSQIVPNLLLYAGSCLVIDIKGENYSITGDHRRSLFDDARVIKFAPFEADTDRYNPLDFIRVAPSGEPTSLTFDDTRLIAEMLIPGRANDSFWDLEARNLLTMLLYYVATKYPPKHYSRQMQTVTELLFPKRIASDQTPIDQTINLIKDEADISANALLEAFLTQFTEHEEKVRSSILSTCRGAMSIWLSERLQAATAKSDFHFSDLKRSMCRPENQNPAPTSLYIIIPPEFLREYRAVLRMIVGLAAIEMTRPADWDSAENLAAGWRAKPPCPVLFLLDEFPALGHMSPIEQGMAYLAGYGVQIWTFAQSLGQLRDIYKENWSTFVSNSGAASYFGITDPDLCEYLSKQLGTTGEYAASHLTRAKTEGDTTSWSNGTSYTDTRSFGSYDSGSSSGSSRGGSESYSDGSSRSTTVTENIRFKDEPLALASEIRAMPKETQLVLLRNRRAVLANLLPYHKCELFTSLYGTWRA